MSEERIKSNHRRRSTARREAKEQALPMARLRYTRGSPQKAREVMDLIRGKSVDEAISILRICKRRTALSALKTLKSAMANAHENNKMKVETLYVARCWIEEGPVFKRILPRARGRADRFKKRTHHQVIVLGEIR